MEPTRTIIMGAAGRDFHNFNVIYRDHPRYNVVAFKATQIPNIDGRRYPASLAGHLYPHGIPIHPESDLETLIRSHDVQEVVFSYSDVSYISLMHRCSVVTAAGADFKVLSATGTMLKSTRPVVAVCAVRTGSGKSQTTRRVANLLRGMGLTVAAVCHPRPFGDRAGQKLQRAGTLGA